jgi:hypothetical protein
VFQARKILPDSGQHGGVTIAGKKNLGPRVIEDIGRLLACQAKVQRHDDPADLGNGIQHLDELETVGLKNGHPVSR